MRGAYVRACVRAEMKRARRQSQPPDVDHLVRETGLAPSLIRSVILYLERQAADERYRARFGHLPA